MLTRHLQYNPGGCCCSWSTFFFADSRLLEISFLWTPRCTRAIHPRCERPRCNVEIPFRFHSCFKISHTGGCTGIFIYIPWMGNAWKRAWCLCGGGGGGGARAARPFVDEQGPCRFQFPEVSAGPEPGWKLIHQPGCRFHCAAPLFIHRYPGIYGGG